MQPASSAISESVGPREVAAMTFPSVGRSAIKREVVSPSKHTCTRFENLCLEGLFRTARPARHPTPGHIKSTPSGFRLPRKEAAHKTWYLHLGVGQHGCNRALSTWYLVEVVPWLADRSPHWQLYHWRWLGRIVTVMCHTSCDGHCGVSSRLSNS